VSREHRLRSDKPQINRGFLILALMLDVVLYKAKYGLKQLTSSSSSCCGSSAAAFGENAVTGESIVEDKARFFTETGVSLS
jgi:hypothetical protein